MKKFLKQFCINCIVVGGVEAIIYGLFYVYEKGWDKGWSDCEKAQVEEQKEFEILKDMLINE